MNRKSTVSMLVLVLLVSAVFPIFSEIVKTSKANPNSEMLNGIVAHSLTDSQAALLSNSNINCIRGDVSLYYNSDWVQHSFFEKAQKNNLTLVGTLGPITMNYKNFNLSSWNQTVNDVVHTYGSKVVAWEIWNEPTYNNSYLGYYQGTAQQYYDLLRSAYAIIKSQYPNATVLGLGGLPLYTSSEGPISGTTWVQYSLDFAQQVVALGGMNYCDAISLHFYPYGPYVPNTGLFCQQTMGAYQSLTGNKPVWITETCLEEYSPFWASSQQEQANFLSTSYNLFKNSEVKAYFWYELCDNYQKNLYNPTVSNFGLYDVNGNPKLALDTYLTVTGGLRSGTTTLSVAQSGTQDSAIVVSSGSSFDVDIRIDNATNVFGWGLILNWTPNVLRLVKVTEGSFLKQSGVETLFLYSFINNSLGTIPGGINCFLMDYVTASGSGTLVKLSFQALCTGNATISINPSESVLTSIPRADWASPIPFLVSNGKVTVLPTSDFNHDGKVDFTDITYFVDAYISYNHGKSFDTACDLNQDQKMDFSDVTLLVSAYIAYSQSLATQN